MSKLLDAAKAVIASGRYHISAHTSHGEDHEFLSHAIAAAERQAADDATPIDDEWLLSIGFEDFEAGQGNWLTGLKYVVSDGFRIVRNADGTWLMRGDYLPFQPINRGQLRRLIAALKGDSDCVAATERQWVARDLVEVMKLLHEVEWTFPHRVHADCCEELVKRGLAIAELRSHSCDHAHNPQSRLAYRLTPGGVESLAWAVDQEMQ